MIFDRRSGRSFTLSGCLHHFYSEQRRLPPITYHKQSALNSDSLLANLARVEGRSVRKDLRYVLSSLLFQHYFFNGEMVKYHGRFATPKT